MRAATTSADRGIPARRIGCASRYLFCALPRVVELAVTRIAVDHVLRIGVKEMLQNESALGVGQASAGLSAHSRNGSAASPAAYSATCTIIDGTRLNVWWTLGNSSRIRTMP